MNENALNENQIIDEGILQAMGISRPAYEEIQAIVGRLPTIDELGTLMAMWHGSGHSQGLLSWLKGQPHSVESHDYLDSDAEPQGKDISEPRIKDCIDIARQIATTLSPAEPPAKSHFVHRGDAIYMIGDVSGLFVNSEYGRRYLHLADNPIAMHDDAETREYMNLILSSLTDNGVIYSCCNVGKGGLFGTMVQCAAPMKLGFDILTCREVRLDSFLFGEEGVRYVATTDESHEDTLLQKLVEARLNCCFLGRTTKGRVLVDGMDFGSISRYM